MKRLIIAAVGVALVVGLLALGGAPVRAEPVASITLPDPSGTVQLYPGCNNISLTFPDGTASQTVVAAVTPTDVVEAMWRHDAALNRWDGYSPEYPEASDLVSVNFLDAVWICTAGAGGSGLPLPPPSHFSERVTLDGAPTTEAVANISLPPPGVTRDLYPGCNNIALTFPDGTASQTVVEAVTPTEVVEALWRYDAALNRWEGYSPEYPQASDLMSVNFLDAVCICTAGAGGPWLLLPPNRFLGDVTLDGSPAPPGTNVTATIGGSVCGQTTVKADWTYVLDVVSYQTVGCGTEGVTVGFTVAGHLAGSATWHSGYFTELDLAPGAVGGIAELPDVEPEAVATEPGSSGLSPLVLASVAAGVLAFAVLATLSVKRRIR